MILNYGSLHNRLPSIGSNHTPFISDFPLHWYVHRVLEGAQVLQYRGEIIFSFVKQTRSIGVSVVLVEMIGVMLHWRYNRRLFTS